MSKSENKLPYSTRFLFATGIPTVSVFASVFAFCVFYFQFTEAFNQTRGIFENTGHSAAGTLDPLGIAALALGFVAVAIFVIFLSLVFNFCASFVPWKTRRSALAGGLGAYFVWTIIAIFLVRCFLGPVA